MGAYAVSTSRPAASRADERRAQRESTREELRKIGPQAALVDKLREAIPEAQRKDGASLKHDISVPVSQVPRFIEVAGGWVAQNVPQGMLVAYGHLGDGNLHFNVNQRAGTQANELQAIEQQVRRAIHDLVRDFGGSFSAEHGIGQLKVLELERYAPAVELELMRAIKNAFDPNGIMNPGKVLRARGAG